MLTELVNDFAFALKALDQTRPVGKSKTREYLPGVGPLSEAQTVKGVLSLLQAAKAEQYLGSAPCRYPTSKLICDCRIPLMWVVEFKLVRPFGDNGKEAEHWSENLLHPYSGNVSAIADCLKLRDSGFAERKAIVVFGYEHTPPRIDLDVAVRAFEKIASDVVGLSLSARCSATAEGLVHPYHQQAKVFGWEIIS
jgi:hypothetical protein